MTQYTTKLPDLFFNNESERILFEHEQLQWIQFVISGKSLSLVPHIHRRDEVCFFASKYLNNESGLSVYEQWAISVLPFIPVDILLTGFLVGNMGYQMKRDEEEALSRRLFIEPAKKRRFFS